MPKIKPMLTTVAKEPFTDNGWIYEIKWDGLRLIAEVTKGKVSLYDKAGRDMTTHFKLITNELEGQEDMILDGEVVILDEEGKPDRSALENYSGKGDLVYYVFDLLSYEGKSWMKYSLIQRKEMLLQAIKKVDILTYSDHFDDGVGLFSHMKQMSLEGIVAKRKESIYQPGVKSKDWVTVTINKKGTAKKIIVKKLPDVYDAVMEQIRIQRAKKLLKENTD